MAKEITPLDVTDAPDLLELAEEVRRSGQGRVLRRNSEDIAVVMPVPPRSNRNTRKGRTDVDREVFLSSAGGWKGNVDVEQFLEDIEASRRITRPPVEL